MSEALRLADLLEPCCLTIGDAQQAVAAAELRRLHALNTELVEALKDLLFWGADDVYQRSKIACERARAAIDAARSKE